MFRTRFWPITARPISPMSQLSFGMKSPAHRLSACATYIVEPHKFLKGVTLALFEYLVENASNRAAGLLDAQDSGQRRCDVVDRDMRIILARFDARTHEDDRHVRVVVEWRAVRR